jgi:MGT family glycosyltransferase
MLHFLLRALPRLPRVIKLRRQLLREHGRESLPGVLFPCVGDLNVVFTSRALQPDTSFIDERFRFVGPSIDPDTRAQDDFPFERLDGNPITYISLGTIHSDPIAQHDFYERAFEAFAAHQGQFILSAGRDTEVSSLPDAPPNFIVRKSVPQLELLKHVDVFVTHGGMNSLHESLYFGVPLVIVPQQMEQFANALQMKRTGAGIVIGDTPPYGRVTARELRAAVDQVLADPSYKQRAHTIGQSLRNAGGYSRAVDEIEALLLTSIRGAAHHV